MTLDNIATHKDKYGNIFCNVIFKCGAAVNFSVHDGMGKEEMISRLDKLKGDIKRLTHIQQGTSG